MTDDQEDFDYSDETCDDDYGDNDAGGDGAGDDYWENAEPVFY
jgi:hypothetical protein